MDTKSFITLADIKFYLGKMNKLRYLTLVGISILAIVLSERFYHFLTDGFSIHRISHFIPSPHPFDEIILFDPKMTKEIDKALLQEFHYLDSGSQCFAFVSSDHQYVLKFFKHHRWRLSFFEQLWLSLPFCKETKEKKLNKKYNSHVDTYKSYCTSFEKFRKKTGLLLIHLCTGGKEFPVVTIRDRIYRRYTIPLDNFTFLLQRRATPMNEYIAECKGDMEKIRKLITEYLDLIEERARLGYLNKDPSFARNFGVCNDLLVEIDIGGCFQDPKKDIHYFYSRELSQIEEKLCVFFKKNPSLCKFIREEIECKRASFSH